ncbi:MAG: toll/interleukin-1 receptor domain-containing protein [Candidatus Binatia bacterium]
MTGPLKDQKLKVFISYSRADLSFADELVAGLAYDGRYEVTIDRHSIIEGEDWRLRLGALIADADTVVFILSPASAKSDICAWEVDEAHRLSKRILPVLAAPVGAISVPKKLSALNYVRFDSFDDGRPRSFMAGLNALVRALNTDVAWLREHTRYLALARSWDEAGRTANRLLSGSDISTAKGWTAERPKDAPHPTELHLDFIRASEEAEAARASAERQRIAEIDAAQQARADALTQVELATAENLETSRRLVGRTRALRVVGGLLGLAIVAVALVYAWDQKTMADRQATVAKEQAALIQKLEAETARADKLPKLVSKYPEGIRAMEKICLEAIQVTSVLATTSDKSTHEQSRDRFWELYYGPMYIVELHQAKNSSGTSAIETSMVMFGRQLKAAEAATEPLPHKSLCLDSKAVRDECVAYLKVAAREPCT